MRSRVFGELPAAEDVARVGIMVGFLEGLDRKTRHRQRVHLTNIQPFHRPSSVVIHFYIKIPNYLYISIYTPLLTLFRSRPVMDPSQVDIPPLKDLTIDNITENVHMINSRCPDPRLKYLLESLVNHVHDFARETRLSTNEWMAALQFLTSVGQISSDVRQVCECQIFR